MNSDARTMRGLARRRSGRRGLARAAIEAVEARRLLTVLTFDATPALGAPIAGDYGDRVTAGQVGAYQYGLTGGPTPNVVVDYGPDIDIAVAPSGFGDLTNVVYHYRDTTLLEVTLRADPGFQVTLNSFDMGGWNMQDYTIAKLSVRDGGGGVLFSQDNVAIEGNLFGAPHSHFTFNSVTATTLVIRMDSTNLGSNADNVGMDNITFMQSGSVSLQADTIVTGPGVGGDPTVRAFSPDIMAQQKSIDAFALGFRGGVRVARGDLTGDGTPDLIVGTGVGAAHVKVFNGSSGNQIAGPLGSWLVYPGPGNTPQDPNSDYYRLAFQGGIFVASGDYNDDGRDDLITAADAGAEPHVKVFSGVDGSVLASFFAFDPGFQGGVRVASADIDGDGIDDIIVGAGPGAGPHVKVFFGNSGYEPQQIPGPGSFFAFDTGFDSGLYVAGGDVNGDGRADVIVGAGDTASPHVKAFSGIYNTEIASFFAFDPAATFGATVAAVDVNGDGRSEIVAGSPTGLGQVKVFDMLSGYFPSTLWALEPYAGYTGGVYVAGA